MLLAQTAQGDTEAFEKLYRECSAPLYRVILRMLRIEAPAQEVLQETFVKIWSNSDRYDPSKAKPMVWMTRIAKNHAIDTLRHQQIRVDLELDDSNMVLDMLQENQFSSYPTQLEHTNALLMCLDQLKEKPRYCVIRAYCEGYSHEELSSLTGSPIGTVKSWIRRSLESLKRCLNEHG